MNTESNQTPSSEILKRNVRDGGDLDWTAFQYIAGELSAADAESFEERLATDQVAREAVALAVELAETTAVALRSADWEPVSGSPRLTRGWNRSVAWMICGSAAALIIAVTLLGVLQPPAGLNGNGAQIAEGQGEVRELAMAWATGRTDLTAPDLNHDVPEISEETLTTIGADTEEVDTIETPSWMLIAVAGLAKDGAISTDQNEQGLE